MTINRIILKHTVRMCYPGEPYDGKLSRTVLRAVLLADPYSLLATCLIIQILTGAFLAMHVRLLILETKSPVILITMIEFMSCKPTDLPIIEMRRGVEHVGKVLQVTSYRSNKGEVLFIYVLIIHPSQYAKLISKVAETIILRKIVENAYAILNSLQMTYRTSIRMETKDEIRDDSKRTGDLLSQVIDILGLETKGPEQSTTRRDGDGVNVVPYGTKHRGLREGLQDSIIQNKRTSILLHPFSIVKTNVKGYYSKPTLTRNISSKSLNNIELYKNAYKIIKSKPGNMTKGIDKHSVDAISIQKLTKLRDSVVNWKYQCSPTKKISIYIPKANGNLIALNLGIASIEDRIIMVVLKFILKAKCDQIFQGTRYGLKPTKSVHHALLEVKSMRGITWMIVGDLKGYFNTIDYHLMDKILSERLNPDRTIMGLIWKLIKAGYMVEGNLKHSILGIPVNGILSPILSNLYLTPFDEFIEELKHKYKKFYLSTSPQNSEYNSIEWTVENHSKKNKIASNISAEEIRLIKKNPCWIKNNQIIRTIPTVNSSISQIHYVRYADEWVIGVKGPYELAVKITEEVNIFLKDKLKLELSIDKTKITHLGTEYAKFLGYYIKCNTACQTISSRKINTAGKVLKSQSKKSTGQPKLIVPKNVLKAKLIQNGFANEQGFPKYLGKFIFLSDYEIVQRYNSILKGYMNYYNIADDRTSLNELIYILEYSLAHTLGAKHRLSLNKVFKKYGKPIKVIVKSEDTQQIVVFDRPISLRAEYLNSKYMTISRWKDSNDEPTLPFDPLAALF